MAKTVPITISMSQSRDNTKTVIFWNHTITQGSSLSWCLCACVFACLLVVAGLQCIWDHTKTVILTEANVCVLACLSACLLWLNSSVSEITQKQWFSRITQKQWSSLGLVFVVCLLACWFACHVKNGSVQKTVQETEDLTKRIFLLPHGRGESDPTVFGVGCTG